MNDITYSQQINTASDFVESTPLQEEDLEKLHEDLINQVGEIMGFISTTDWPERARLLREASILMNSLHSMNIGITETQYIENS